MSWTKVEALADTLDATVGELWRQTVRVGNPTLEAQARVACEQSRLLVGVIAEGVSESEPIPANYAAISEGHQVVALRTGGASADGLNLADLAAWHTVEPDLKLLGVKLAEALEIAQRVDQARGRIDSKGEGVDLREEVHQLRCLVENQRGAMGRE